MIEKIISGGQTGADRAGLVAAQTLKLPTGGVAPLGFRTENGPDPSLREFGLIESKNDNYGDRTWRNILNSDGTLLFGRWNSPGSKLTERICTQEGKPLLKLWWPFGVLRPRPSTLPAPRTPADAQQEEFIAWVRQNNIRTLNVAGNRESVNPGIGEALTQFLVTAIPLIEKET